MKMWNLTFWLSTARRVGRETPYEIGCLGKPNNMFRVEMSSLETLLLRKLSKT